MTKTIDFNDRASILHEYGINLSTKTVYVSGAIDAEANLGLRIKFDIIKDYCQESNEELKEFNLILSSLGGDATSIEAIMDLYDSYKKEGILINIHVEGISFSAATFFTCCATGKRTASKRARFLVHEIQISGAGGTHTQTKSFTTELNHLNEIMLQAYTECTLKKMGYYGIDNKCPEQKVYDKIYKAWNKRTIGETYLSSQEACELGLIDEVI